MTEKEDFFSPKHKQLLSIATWAKYLAWAALIYYLISAGLAFNTYQVDLQRVQLYGIGPANIQSFSELLKITPLDYWVDIISNMLNLLLRGAIYYVVLKGISLGLNMIVETDINYRESNLQEDKDEQ